MVQSFHASLHLRELLGLMEASSPVLVSLTMTLEEGDAQMLAQAFGDRKESFGGTKTSNQMSLESPSLTIGGVSMQNTHTHTCISIGKSEGKREEAGQIKRSWRRDPDLGVG